MSEEVAAPQGTKNIVVAPAIKSICSSTGKKQQCLTSSIRFLALRHPRTKTLVLYGLSDSMANRSDDTEKAENCTEAQKGTIDFLEVQTINEDFGAWFIGESILGETRALLQLCTPMDPLLVILPYLIDASEKGTQIKHEHSSSRHANHNLEYKFIYIIKNKTSAIKFNMNVAHKQIKTSSTIVDHWMS